MGVEVGIEGPAHPVDETGRGHAVDGHRHGGTDGRVLPAHGQGPTLDVGHGGAHRFVVSGGDGVRHVAVAEGVEDAHRLRRREGHIEARYADPRPRRS